MSRRAGADAVGCASYRDAHDVVHHLELLAVDQRRHVALVRCADCRTFYEVPSAGRSGIVDLTPEQVRSWYPDLGAEPAATPIRTRRHLHVASEGREPGCPPAGPFSVS